MKCILLLCLFFSLFNSAFATKLLEQDDVQSFINTMVTQHHYNRQTLEDIFNQVSIKNSIIKAMNRPYESITWDKYRSLFLKKSNIRNGVKFWQKNKTLLATISKKYRVDPAIIVATVGVESAYGRNTGSYRVLDALATLSFDYPRRATFFQNELKEFLLFIKRYHIKPFSVYGSYAGAIGQLQFIDNSILVVDLPVSDMVQQQQVENSVLGVSVISTDISQQQTIDNTSLDVSLSVSNIIQNELLENTSLVPSLLINSLSQMQVLGTSSVKVSLITSDISQGQIVNSSTLIQEYNLIINDVDQEQLVESTGSELRLFPVDINQLQVLDGSQIVQNHLLSVQNISQNQNIDSTLLTVSLSTGDLNQNQSTGNVVLGLDLVSDSISQQQLIDIVNLGFGLVTGNINQDQSVEGTSIVQSYSIQVDEISQSQILSNVRLGSIILAVMDGDIKIGTLFIANELKLSSLFNSSIKIY